MEEQRQWPPWTQSDALAEVVSAASCHLVLETSPPDYVEKISRYLESSVGQNGRDETPAAPSEADSDSGDSLFITQKPVPEAVRSGRRRRSSLRSDPQGSSPRGLEDSDDDTSPSTSHGESRTGKEKKRQRHKLPKYSFSFLKERGWKPTSTVLPVKQNTRLHNSAMGGFFKCVQEWWQSYKRGEDEMTPLPRVDMDGEDISPISEEEEEGKPEDEDIRVVERRHFVVPSKGKSTQTWYTAKKTDSQVQQQRRTRRPSADGHETSQRWKTLRKTQRVTMSSDTESSDDGDSSAADLGERETSAKRAASDRSILGQTETPKTKRHPSRAKMLQQKEKEDGPCEDEPCEDEPCEDGPCEDEPCEDGPCEDSKATVCELSPEKGLPSLTGQGGCEPESQSLLQSGTNDDRVCSEPRVKKRRKVKGDDGNVEEGEGRPAATSVTVGIIEVEETPGHSQTINGPCEDSDATVCEPSPEKGLPKDGDATVTEPQADGFHTDEPSLTGRGGREPESQSLLQSGTNDDAVGSEPRVKKRKKKKKVKGDDGSVEEGEGRPAATSVTVEEVEETPGLSQTIDDPEVNEQISLQSSSHDDNMLSQEESDIPDLKPKKKKRRRKKLAAGDDGQEVEVEDSLKKKRRKRNDDEEEEEDVEPLKSNTAAEHLNDVAEIPKKKKKKKRKKGWNMASDQAPVEPSEEMRGGEASEETSESSCVKRKKHKKKQQSASNDDAAGGGEECRDVSSANDVTTLAGSTELKSVAERVEVSYTPEEDEGQTTETVEVQDAELMTKKKKKKNRMREISSFNVSGDTEARGDESGSVQEKEKKKKKKKKRTSSFLVADAEEKAARTPEEKHPQHECCAEKTGSLEESSDGVRKKKKKRKKSAEQEGKDHEAHEEPDEPCQGGLDETRVKGEKKRRRNESESATSVERSGRAAEAGCSDEAVVLKKKKKKGTRDLPAAADTELEQCSLDTWSSTARKKNDKRGHGPEISHDGSEASEATLLASETPGNQTLSDARDKKKKKKLKSARNVLLEGEPLTQTAEIETHKTRKDPQKPTADPSFTLSETSRSKPDSSQGITEKKRKKAKRTLHNPTEDFLQAVSMTG